MVCPLNCCHALQQSSHSLVLWWMPAVGAAKHQQGLRVCGLLGLELVHWNAIQMNLGMDNKQQEVTYKFMQNLIICILKTKKENGWLILFYFFFFFNGMWDLSSPPGIETVPLQWNHSLNHWRGSVSHSIVSDSLQTHGHCLPGSSVLGILQAGILEWVAIPCSRGSSQPGDLQTWVSYVADRFFTIWATWELDNLHFED